MHIFKDRERGNTGYHLSFLVWILEVPFSRPAKRRNSLFAVATNQNLWKAAFSRHVWSLSWSTWGIPYYLSLSPRGKAQFPVFWVSMKRLTCCRRFQFSLQLGNALSYCNLYWQIEWRTLKQPGKTPPSFIQCSVTTFQISRLSKTEKLAMFSKRYCRSVSHLPIGVHIHFWQEPMYFRNSPFCCCCDIILLFQFSHLKSVASLGTSLFADRADIYKPVVESS